MLGVLLIAVGLNVVEMLKPRSRPTVDGLQNVVVYNVVDGCRSPLCRHSKRLHRSVVMLILIYVCRLYLPRRAVGITDGRPANRLSPYRYLHDRWPQL